MNEFKYSFNYMGIEYTYDDLVEILKIRCIDDPLDDDYTIISARIGVWIPVGHKHGAYLFTICINYKSKDLYYDIFSDNIKLFNRNKKLNILIDE